MCETAGSSDDPRDTVSYSDIYRQVQEIVEGEPKKPIETVAEATAARLLASFQPVQCVTVTVRKPEAPIRDSLLTRRVYALCECGGPA